jgi:hypothetical protein
VNLKEVIPEHMEGILVISDVHGEYKRMKKAIDYALANYQFIVFLGDLVDGGNMPFETVEEVYSLLEKNQAACVYGNHDYKWYRAIKGAPVQMTEYMTSTLLDVPNGLEQCFLELYEGILDHDLSYYNMNFDNWHFVHAAMPDRAFTANDDDLTKEEHERMMYGYTNGKRDSRGYPIRLYEWIDYIPKGDKVVIGHDRAPMGKVFDGRPEMVCGVNGGIAIFTDTGCGKRDDGTLTTTSLLFADGDLIFERFITY